METWKLVKTWGNAGEVEVWQPTCLFSLLGIIFWANKFCIIILSPKIVMWGESCRVISGLKYISI